MLMAHHMKVTAGQRIDDDDDDFWFGFEQEYFLWDPDTNLPLASLTAAILVHRVHTTVP